MVTLRNFTYDDIELLKKSKYPDRTCEEIQKMIEEWNLKEYQGKYYEMFAIVNGEDIVGTISLYQKSENVITIGPEVIHCHRQRGFGKEAMIWAMEIAEQKGYKIVEQQIRMDNTASIVLHQSIGFETGGYVYINKKGRDVLVYLKSLC